MAELSRQELPIRSEDDVFLVRRAVRGLAESRGFDTFAVAAVTTAASELGRNAWVHGGGGAATLMAVEDSGRTGIEIEFRDQGPGIADVQRVLEGGFSTARSLGLGVSGSRRLVDEFDLQTEVGRGTVVRVRKWKRY